MFSIMTVDGNSQISDSSSNGGNLLNKVSKKINIDIPFSAILFSNIDVVVTLNCDFKINIPQIDNFRHLNTKSANSTNLTNGGRVTNFSKILTFKCEKVGELTFPPLNVIVDRDTFKTSSQMIKVIPLDKLLNVKRDSVSMLPYIDSLKEINFGHDFFVKAEIDKNKYKVNDSIFIRLTLYNGLSNSISPESFSKIIYDSAEVKIINSDFKFKGYQEIDGRNYKTYSLPLMCIIFRKAGNYNLNDIELNGSISIYKSKKKDSFDDFFGLNENKTNIIIPISKKIIKITK